METNAVFRYYHFVLFVSVSMLCQNRVVSRQGVNFDTKSTADADMRKSCRCKFLCKEREKIPTETEASRLSLVQTSSGTVITTLATCRSLAFSNSMTKPQQFCQSYKKSITIFPSLFKLPSYINLTVNRKTQTKTELESIHNYVSTCDHQCAERLCFSFIPIR